MHERLRKGSDMSSTLQADLVEVRPTTDRFEPGCPAGTPVRPLVAGGSAGSDRIRVAVIDDQPILAAGAQVVIDAEPDMDTVATFDRPEAVSAQLRSANNVDVLVADLSYGQMPGDGSTLLNVLRWGPKVVVCTSFDSQLIRDACRQAGAHGFVGKGTSAASLPAVIRAVTAGWYAEAGVTSLRVRRPLKQSELDVLSFLPTIGSSRGIAAEVNLSSRSVDNMVSELMAVTDTNSRSALAAWAALHGFGLLRSLRETPRQ